jgi:lysophospholipase L1-like esterase
MSLLPIKVKVKQCLASLSFGEGTRVRSKTQRRLYILLLMLAACSPLNKMQEEQKPTLYIIGDSTVRNSNQVGWGWGTLISDYFDTTKITVSNQAMAGRSTRTFIKEGRWDKVISGMKKRDFLFMQFGHNEGSRPDTSRAGYRGVLKGTSDDSVVLTWPDGTKEVVHSYGWYIRKFVREAKGKGATPVVMSMIPRNEFREGKVIRAGNDYGKWAKEAADAEGAFFVDLNAITSDKYDKWGPDEVKKYFPQDHTHTNKEGANINAQSVVDGIRQNKAIALNKYLLKSK